MLKLASMARIRRLKITLKARAYRAFVSFTENPKRYGWLFAMLLCTPMVLLVYDGYRLQRELAITSDQMLQERLPAIERFNDTKAALTRYQLMLQTWFSNASINNQKRLEHARNTANTLFEQINEQELTQLWQQTLTLEYQLQAETQLTDQQVSEQQATFKLQKISFLVGQLHNITATEQAKVIKAVEAQEQQTLALLQGAKSRSLILDSAMLVLLLLAFALLYRYLKASNYYRHKAFHDRVTGLPNQSKMLLDLHQKRRQNTILVALELNNLEIYVAGQGYDIIEQIHRAFSHHLLNILDELNLNFIKVYRSGKGIYLLSGPVENKAEVDAQIKRIREALHQPIHTTIGEYHPRWNRGATMVSPTTPPEQALDQLYSALAEAGYKGQDSLQFFSNELRDKRKRRWAIQQALGQAIRDNQLSVHYQPQFELHSGKMVGAEALLRWHHPDIGQVSPAEFIPIAEQSGLIIDVGRWVLRTAVHQAAFWYHHGFPTQIAINISPRQFEHPDFISELEQLLKEAELPASFIELEITEGVLMKDAQGCLTALHELKRIGVSLAIDDFGKGYSSLSYLHRFPIDKLKIDRSFICDVHESDMDQVIARIIIELGRQLDLQVIAEGVELEQQAQWLSENGCHLAQGYLMGKPMGSGDLHSLLLNQKPHIYQ
ncbi:EAL domain-containing protein [Neiella sp. HB171785]|uniref:cyclic-guanylate-specific phosphodiesterase n=1 Tax=Neiella litorisoli TaxID=2771431 RepID=A0A8J6QUL4_9GAMM|nr:GGDEF domain-containing phosphodiesterase [Neiella litorisoli]MBD1389188.1 EAL domain-containing protein [Neiella litorisoli]